MWERFTEEARQAVFAANGEALKTGGGFVSTEHLLLGLLSQEESQAIRLLRRLKVVITEIEGRVRAQIHPSAGVEGALTLTPRGKRAIDFAYHESLSLGDQHIGTEHLLLGLIRERDGLAGRVLNHFRVELEQARAAARFVTKQEDTAGQSGEPIYGPPDHISYQYDY
jgi:ATP-dependent Clp protease ATP-binding subunit ClpC